VGSRLGFRRALAEPRLWLVALGFALRLVWVLAVPSRPVGDFALYREAAAYLVERGSLDPEFIYMPGYVFLLAAVEALGGGLRAAKLVGVVAGTAVVAAVGGIAHHLYGRRAGVTAAALAALWPAGIAVASVTGTDMPAAALIALGIWALVGLGPTRPWTAAVVLGLVMGLGAWVRAVAVPLAAASLLYWLALGVRPRAAALRAALSMAIALAALVPWGLRNWRLYGELFVTDSHGGHTALVGANPNSEGTYSRSLNRMFSLGTGYRLFETPDRHRASDRAAYLLARRFAAFEPAYALGLLGAKADRLLSHERNLLYWPIYRAGVLDGTPGVRAFWDRHRRLVEGIADGTWWAVAALAAAGAAIAARRRNWPGLALLVFPLGLAAIYTLFFSEVRYHLAIAPLLFPGAAEGAVWLAAGARRRFRGDGRTALVALSSVIALGALWWGGLAAGQALRDRHRWAVAVCSYPGAARAPQLCTWRRVTPPGGPSPVRGVWDGVGLRLGAGTAAGGDLLASARTTLALDAGGFAVRGTLSVSAPAASEPAPAAVPSATARPVPAVGPEVAVRLRAGGHVVARTVLPALGPPAEAPISGRFAHAGGPLDLSFEVERIGAAPPPSGATVWFSGLLVE
jgi:4-amino-4-deoxy-L-arabinose transferase-like glycosyltransferase